MNKSDCFLIYRPANTKSVASQRNLSFTNYVVLAYLNTDIGHKNKPICFWEIRNSGKHAGKNQEYARYWNRVLVYIVNYILVIITI